jgi:diguanylate cyclase
MMTIGPVDALTGLPGPAALPGLLAAADAGHALLLLDLDDFHARNLRDGFEAGDRLLCAVAGALVAALPDGEVLRLSADEFGVLMPCADLTAAVERGRALAAGLAALEPSLTACGGVAMLVLDTAARGSSVAVLPTVRQAGLALRAARQLGPGAVVGPPEGRGVLREAEQDDLEVRTALRTGSYELYFQPLVTPMTSRPVGVEALVRWRQDPTRIVGPGEFLPQVRRAGIAAEFGATMIGHALETWETCLRSAVADAADPAGHAGHAGHAPILSVNVDVEQAEQDGFDRLVLHLLHRRGVPPQDLVIEVAESVLAEPAAVERLRRLRAAGVAIAIDDFGAGPVVLSEIRELPVDIIKVDQVLVGRLDPLAPDLGLIEDLHRLAALLGLRLAVEAVETQLLAQRIAALGVPLAQGFHYAHPMPSDEVARWLRAGVVPGAATPGGAGE